MQVSAKLKPLGNLTHDTFKAVQKYFGGHYELMIRKGVYLYDYMDGAAKLEKTKLPPKE